MSNSEMLAQRAVDDTSRNQRINEIRDLHLGFSGFLTNIGVMASAQLFKDRTLLAVIGDEDSITGLLLAGIGHVGEDGKKNFLIVDTKTEVSTIEKTFEEFTTRKDIAILLINQHLADKIRYRVDNYTAAFPTILEIPSKEHPYDPEKDSVLKRLSRLLGND